MMPINQETGQEKRPGNRIIVATLIIIVSVIIYVLILDQRRFSNEELSKFPVRIILKDIDYGPIKNNLFIASFGVHFIDEVLYQKHSTIMNTTRFFIYDNKNHTPFRHDLPSQIGVDYFTGKFSNVNKTVGYIVDQIIATDFAWNKDMTDNAAVYERIMLFLDNATEEGVNLYVDDSFIGFLPAFSHSKIDLLEGIHNIAVKVPTEEYFKEQKDVLICKEDPFPDGEKVEFYLYNIASMNSYMFKCAQYGKE